MTDDKSEMIPFETIDREISLLLKRLRNKGVCPCCAARGMIFHGAHLLMDTAGAEETIETCLDIVDAIENPDAEMSETQH